MGGTEVAGADDGDPQGLAHAGKPSAARRERWTRDCADDSDGGNVGIVSRIARSRGAAPTARCEGARRGSGVPARVACEPWQSPRTPTSTHSPSPRSTRCSARQSGELAEDKIAPRAAEIDETGEFPWDVYEALRANDFHAIHIPEKFGGQGGDALAACLVIEEVARVCASSSLIPAVNKLGTMPLLVGASDDLLGRYLPQVASGEAMFSYALSRAGGRLGRRVDEVPRRGR